MSPLELFRRQWMLLLLLPCFCWTTAAIANSIPRVQISEIAIAPVQIILPLAGTVTALHRASLSPSLSGLVVEIHADTGDEVEAGQALLSLDAELARLALDRARAATAEARASHREAERLLLEARSLFTKRTIPETQVKAQAAQVEISAAALQRLEAEEREQQERLARHQLKAPFAGVIAQRYTDAGEWLNTGDQAFELVALRPLLLNVQVPQSYSALVNEQTPVSVRFDGIRLPPLQTHISTRVPVKDPQARTFLARVRLDNPQRTLTPGMSATAVLQLDTGERSPLVPRDAVLRAVGGQTFVWVLRDNGGRLEATRRQVELGQATADGFQVKRGLQAGERVVVRGNEVLQEGQAVLVGDD